ncbi:transporter substrate-binding domain-containing protein [Corynebacterium sp. A21]|uniref:transporter substrate-binding domain-containing protein n=1 Tax=Corynebacterium sp. A21 TaxID=3457318 RepID=UPI003FD24231
MRNNPLIRRRAAALGGFLLAASLTLSACADPVDPANGANARFNLSADQDRIRSQVNPELAALVPEKIAADGQLTLGTLVTPTPPLVMLATDNATPIGSEIDLAQLVADKLGLELEVQMTSWDNWPLKLDSSEYEIVHANVGITEERLQKYDFSSNRAAFQAFQVKADTSLVIDEIDDLSGLRIAAAAGTNQERMMLTWNEDFAARGMEPIHIYHYVNENDMLLAVLSGRIDMTFGPGPAAAWRAENRDDLAVAWRVNAGWPNNTLVASTVQRGNGLGPLVTQAYNELMAEGTYLQVLERWGLEEEAIPESNTYSLEEYRSAEL